MKNGKISAMGILEEIVKKKKERLAVSKSRTPVGVLKSLIAGLEPPLAFTDAIKGKPGQIGQIGQTGQIGKTGKAGKIRLIAEMKKASPSRGVIRERFEPGEIARVYDEKADAISVLTEEDFFMGRLEYIGVAKGVSQRPVMRKDFIFDEYQIYESRAAGADAILLIERLLDGEKAREFIEMAGELGMAVLFEVHDHEGLETALRIGAPIIGINNRDLDTMKVDIEKTFRLKKEIPAGGGRGGRVVVSESGIGSPHDIERLRDAGIDAVLIGTAFMQAPDIGKKIDELFKHLKHQK